MRFWAIRVIFDLSKVYMDFKPQIFYTEAMRQMHGWFQEEEQLHLAQNT
jgi:hypothetical protein